MRQAHRSARRGHRVRESVSRHPKSEWSTTRATRLERRREPSVRHARKRGWTPNLARNRSTEAATYASPQHRWHKTKPTPRIELAAGLDAWSIPINVFEHPRVFGLSDFWLGFLVPAASCRDSTLFAQSAVGRWQNVTVKPFVQRRSPPFPVNQVTPPARSGGERHPSTGVRIPLGTPHSVVAHRLALVHPGPKRLAGKSTSNRSVLLASRRGSIRSTAAPQFY